MGWNVCYTIRVGTVMAHAASLWQITLDTDPGFLTPVVSEFTTTQLTEFPFSGLVLTPSTDYLARVTYYDELGNSGESAVVPFTTLADGTIPVPLTTQWEECV